MQYFKLGKFIGMCEPNFTVGKIWISKVVFFCLTYNANMLELNFFSRIDESGYRRWNGLKWKDLENIPEQFVFFAALLKWTWFPWTI